MTNKLWMAALSATMALALAGCAADDYMNDITPVGQEPAEGALSDEVTKLLSEAGFEDVRIEDLKFDLSDETVRFYFFTIEQPVSHHNRSLGTYKQHACLRTTDLTAPRAGEVCRPVGRWPADV